MKCIVSMCPLFLFMRGLCVRWCRTYSTYDWCYTLWCIHRNSHHIPVYILLHSRSDADPAFFNTLFVSLGIASPSSPPPSSLFSSSSWMCSYGRVLSDPWRSRRVSTIGRPDRPFVLVVAHPRRTHSGVDEAYTGIRADTLTTRLVGTSAD